MVQLEKKGCVQAEKLGRDKRYVSAVCREACVQQENGQLQGKLEGSPVKLLVASVALCGEIHGWVAFSLMTAEETAASATAVKKHVGGPAGSRRRTTGTR